MGTSAVREQVEEAVDYILGKVNIKPAIAVILGSGQSKVADQVEKDQVFSYEEIPHFPISFVSGHPGKLVIGTWQRRQIAVMQGRVHYYEGYTMTGVTFPIRVLAGLGATSVIITNVAGGINPKFSQGDLMFITDHINFMGQNPLVGLNDPELGPRFLDMSQAYSTRLMQIAEQAAKEEGIKVRQGVYAAVTGPSFETLAEINFLASSGADAVGMSTVPEVIVANQIGLEVLGISCITDASSSSEEKITHDKVLEVAERANTNLIKLMGRIVDKI